MKRRRRGTGGTEGGKDLPVDPARLRAEFPHVTDEEMEAYVAVTRRVLGDPATRARRMREVMAAAREAGEKAGGGEGLTDEERLLARYLAAVAKMQRSTVRRPQ